MVMDGNWSYGCDHFIMYKNTESLCCTPETNTVSYVNFTRVMCIIERIIITTKKAEFG